MSGKRVLGQPVTVDVVDRGVEPEMDERETLDDQILLRGPSESQRDVGFAPREVDVQIGALKLELNLRVALAKPPKVRSDEASGEHLRRGESDHTLELLILAGHIALDTEGFSLDTLGSGEQTVPGLGEDVAGGGAIEQPGAETFFELHKATTDGGGVQLQCSARCGERALPVQGQEIANIIPVKHRLHYRSVRWISQLQNRKPGLQRSTHFRR